MSEMEIDEIISTINIVTKKLQETLDYKLAAVQLSSSNYYFLLKIDRAGSLSRDALNQKIYLNQSNITRRLDQLVQQGLVEKQPSETDKRAFDVRLTTKGKGLISAIEAAISATNEVAFRHFSSQDLTALKKYLGQIKENL